MIPLSSGDTVTIGIRTRQTCESRTVTQAPRHASGVRRYARRYADVTVSPLGTPRGKSTGQRPGWRAPDSFGRLSAWRRLSPQKVLSAPSLAGDGEPGSPLAWAASTKYPGTRYPGGEGR